MKNATVMVVVRTAMVPHCSARRAVNLEKLAFLGLCCLSIFRMNIVDEGTDNLGVVQTAIPYDG